MQDHHCVNQVQQKRCCIKLNVCFYIVLYPVHSTAESTLHFPTWQTVHSDTNSTSLGSIPATQQLRAMTTHSLFPPLCVVMYSFIQLSELGHRGENENAEASKWQQRENFRSRAFSNDSSAFEHKATVLLTHKTPTFTCSSFMLSCCVVLITDFAAMFLACSSLSRTDTLSIVSKVNSPSTADAGFCQTQMTPSLRLTIILFNAVNVFLVYPWYKMQMGKLMLVSVKNTRLLHNG